MDEIKRLTPAQRARCNRLIRRLCANYDGGNCLPLDDGEGCACVQMISCSLLCKYFRRAVLLTDKVLCADIYRVRTEDAVRFKACMDSEPGFLSELSGMFSNRTEWHPLPMFEATPENCEAFRRWLDSQWAELPEALPTQTAAELVGHSPQRIHEWIREEVLVGIKLGSIQYCAKAEFIGFMASPQRLAHPRTEKYKELIREFKYIQRRERENEQRRQKRKMMKEST